MLLNTSANTFISNIADKRQGNVDDYLNKEYLREYFGRDIYNINTDHIDDDMANHIESFLDKNDELFIKNTYKKDASGIVKVVNNDHDDIIMRIHSMINSSPIFDNWSYQLPLYITLQEVLDIGYETRFFCVNGNIVSASGHVIDFIPDHNSSQDPYYYAKQVTRYQSKGNDQQEIITNPYYDLQLELAKTVSKALCDNESTVINCTIDVGFDIINNKPVLIELNNISNSGFYGCDPMRIYNKLFKETIGYNGLTLGLARSKFNETFKLY